MPDRPQQPQQQAPPVQRLRVHYAKRGRLRFTSHRDFSRAFERAVVRARVPVSYSSGFHPHPRISYAGAAPTGAGSEAEYLEVALARESDPDEVARALDEALPPGLDVLRVVTATGGSLTDLLEGSVWRSRLPGVSHGSAAEAVRAFLDAGEVPVERMTKKGLRSFDSRAAVVRLDLLPETAGETATDEAAGEAGSRANGGECAILEVVLRHATPSVRPDDVLAGLHVIAGLETAGAPFHERLAQGPLDAQTGTVGDPLDSTATRRDRR